MMLRRKAGERLERATAVMKAFGKTYELNFTKHIACGPVLYFAQRPQDMLVIGVIGGRLWTYSLLRT